MNSSILLEDQQQQILMTTIGILLTNEQVPREIFKSNIDQYFGPQHDDFIDSSLGICVLNENNDRLGSLACDNNAAAYVKSQWLYVIDSEPNSIFEFRLGIYNKQNNQIIAEEESLKRVLVPEISHEDIFFIHTDWDSEEYTTGVELKSILYSMDDSLMVSNYESNQADQTEELPKEAVKNTENEDNDSCSYSDSLKAEEHDDKMEKSFEEMEMPQNDDILTPEKELIESMGEKNEAYEIKNEIQKEEEIPQDSDIIDMEKQEKEIQLTEDNMTEDNEEKDDQVEPKFIQEEVENENQYLESENSLITNETDELEVDKQENYIIEDSKENHAEYNEAQICENQMEDMISKDSAIEQTYNLTEQDDDKDEGPYTEEHLTIDEAEENTDFQNLEESPLINDLCSKSNEKESISHNSAETKEEYENKDYKVASYEQDGSQYEESNMLQEIANTEEQVQDFQEPFVAYANESIEEISDNPLKPEDTPQNETNHGFSENISKEFTIETLENVHENTDEIETNNVGPEDNDDVYTEDYYKEGILGESNMEAEDNENSEKETDENERKNDFENANELDYENECRNNHEENIEEIENNLEERIEYKEENDVNTMNFDEVQDMVEEKAIEHTSYDPQITYASEIIHNTNTEDMVEHDSMRDITEEDEMEENKINQKHRDSLTEFKEMEKLENQEDIIEKLDESHNDINNMEVTISEDENATIEKEEASKSEDHIEKLNESIEPDVKTNKKSRMMNKVTSIFGVRSELDDLPIKRSSVHKEEEITHQIGEESQTSSPVETNEDIEEISNFIGNQEIHEEKLNENIEPDVKTNKKSRMMNKVTSIFGVRSELNDLPIKRSSVHKEEENINQIREENQTSSRLETNQDIEKISNFNDNQEIHVGKIASTEIEENEPVESQMTNGVVQVVSPLEVNNAVEEEITTCESPTNVYAEAKSVKTPEEPPKPKRSINNIDTNEVVMESTNMIETIENENPREEIVSKEHSNLIESQPASKPEVVLKSRNQSEGRLKSGGSILPKLKLNNIPTQEEITNKENSSRLYVNDDNKYPDSITPTKVDKKLINETTYDIPFIDDNDVSQAEDSFRINNRNSALGIPNNSQHTFTPRASIESFKDPETPSKTNLHIPIDTSPPPKKKKLFSFCGCMGSKKRS